MKKLMSYTVAELQLLALLPIGAPPIGTKTLIRRYYGSRPPKFHLQAMTYLLRTLKAKIAANREQFELLTTSYSGPYEAQWWILPKTYKVYQRLKGR